jgi:hypothetical protein
MTAAKNNIVLWKNKSFSSKYFYKYNSLTPKYVFWSCQRGDLFFLVVCERHLLSRINPSFCFINIYTSLKDNEINFYFILSNVDNMGV